MWQNLKSSSIWIRDYSSEESQRMFNYGQRGACLYDTDMQQQLACGISFRKYFWPYINQLPNNVYLSIDIDGLEPLNCSKYRNSSS